ncbi:hypothetical protein GCM10023231_26570 [Olivibacter ginsenosidimutans]|uniref:Carboxypeptidase-like regulatory domain-containing protein n=1 Tax=Olivibacter ginsenosidimutans TaxID=1176537 RepID=A0ABP9BP21_9SPHI
MKTVLFFFVVALSVLTTHAQEQFKGIVLEHKSNEAMQQVSVKNLNTGDSVLTNKSGEFSLGAHQDDILTFSAFGYRVDSLVVTDFAVKRVYLSGIADPRVLETVHIMTNSRLKEEMEQLKKEAKYANTVSGGGIGLSPSRIFGNGARNARRQYKILAQESDNRLVDTRFSAKLIQSLTPLEGEDLNIFMAAYRPKVSFIKEANDERLRLYIMDSYNAYKKLDASEKEKLRLKN